MKITQLNIYPVKSLGGISLEKAVITDRGFQYDRRWMLVDEDNRFITQRKNTSLALLQCSIGGSRLIITSKLRPNEKVETPLEINEGRIEQVIVWEDNCNAIHYNSKVDQWLSKEIDQKCKLIYMPDDSHRKASTTYAQNEELNSFADGFPYLIIGEESLKDLNQRLEEQLPMNRFRPNIVFSGGDAFTEDNWGRINIGDAQFEGLKLCGRCTVTTTDQESGLKDKEPLKTLATFRKKDSSVNFGTNMVCHSGEFVSVGDSLKVL